MPDTTRLNINTKGTAQNTYDAIVIGSGISGGWAAKELCEKGLKTLVLERGRNIELPNLAASPENLADPKGEIERQLRLGGVVYTKVVAGEIAQRANLDSFEYWSPSFRRLRAAAHILP